MRLATFKKSLSSIFFQAFLGTLLLFFMSQLAIPLSPVPITLQTVAVMLIGLTFERKAAIGAILMYLTLGAIGSPIFSNFSGGFPVIMGPRGGYLLGFLGAVIFMTTLREKHLFRPFWQDILACLGGTILILLCGIGWLSTFIGLEQAVVSGLLPFILPGFLKIAILVGLKQAIGPRS